MGARAPGTRRLRGAALGLALLVAPAPPRQGPDLVLVGVYDSGHGGGTEIVSIQRSTQRAVLSCSTKGSVDVLDLRLPRSPRRVQRHDAGLAAGEHLTSVAVHPREPIYLVAIQAAGPLAPGRVELRSLDDGRLLRRVPVGVGPDSVVFSGDGRQAAVACEAEAVVLDAERGELHSAPGSVTLLDLQDPGTPRARHVELPSAAGVAGMLADGDGRRLERWVDLDGNGVLEPARDLDGDGTIDDTEVAVATLAGEPVVARESRGERLLLPLLPGPEWLEPEALAFSPDGARLFVTLQESNGIAVIDTAEGRVLGLFDAGTTQAGPCAEREPDGIALTPDGRFLVTADESDTRCPEAGRRARTVSVFDSATLAPLGDTGEGIDRLALAAGVDEAVVRAGVQPEMVVCFPAGGRLLAAVTLERAGAVALISLEDPARPAAVALARCRGEAGASSSPEGIDWLRDRLTGEVYVLSANEGDGTLSVFLVRPGP